MCMMHSLHTAFQFSDEISHLSSRDPHGLILASDIASVWSRLDHMCPLDTIHRQIARGMKLNTWMEQQEQSYVEQQTHASEKKVNVQSVLDYEATHKIKGTEFLRVSHAALVSCAHSVHLMCGLYILAPAHLFACVPPVFHVHV